jgi:hypothetical protein
MFFGNCVWGQVLFEPVEKLVFFRLIKNAQMQGARGAFHLPVRQAILRSEAYLNVRCNDEGRGNAADGRFLNSLLFHSTP